MVDDLKQRLYEESQSDPDSMLWQAANRIEQLEAEVEMGKAFTGQFFLQIEQLEAERDSFYMEYRIKCDEQTKALHIERDELKAAIRNFLCAWDSCRSSGEWPVRRLEELRAAIAKGEK